MEHRTKWTKKFYSVLATLERKGYLSEGKEDSISVGSAANLTHNQSHMHAIEDDTVKQQEVRVCAVTRFRRDRGGCSILMRLNSIPVKQKRHRRRRRRRRCYDCC